MATDYPSGIDNFTDPTSGDTLATSGVIHTGQHTDVNDAIYAMQTELGVLPKGAYSNVAARLAALASAITGIALKADIASPTFTGTVSGITKTMVGLGSVDNTSDVDKPVSTAQQTALNLKADLASPTFTGTVSGITKSMVGLGSVDNTADTAKPVSTDQQTALNLKADLASPTFTGTISGITASMVGLGNVDNTSDVNKPVSTAQQTALNLKADLASPTFTGTVNAVALVLSGDLTVNGTTTTINSTTIAVDDKNIVLGDVAVPTDVTADGGGFTLKGAIDKTFNWVDATDAWTSSEHLNLASGKNYYINGTLLRNVSETISNKTLLSPKEKMTIAAIAATGTVQFDCVTQGILYYTTNASGAFTLNFRGDSGTTLNSLMADEEAITVVFMVTNGATAYYPTAITIDGASITPKYQNGTAPTGGNINSIDSYSITIIRTASATFTATLGQTKFA